MRKTVLAALMIGLLFPLLARGQVLQSTQDMVDGKSRQVLLAELTVSPKTLPVPALKYKLTWGFDQRNKNNAAIQYNAAMQAFSEMKLGILRDESKRLESEFKRVLVDPNYFVQRKAAYEAFEEMLKNAPSDGDRIALRNEASLDFKTYEFFHYCTYSSEKFPIEKARDFVKRFQRTYERLETGSRCENCDWEYHIRGNKEILTVPLPEIQECRDLARALQAKCRLEIFEGKYEDAIRTARVGKILARHMGQNTPMIVAPLIGIAIDSMMNECLLELVQRPDAPNLYWALSTLPDPPFVFTNTPEAEVDLIRIMIPELARAMDDPESLSEEDWKVFDQNLIQMIPAFSNAGYSQETRSTAGLFLAKSWGITAYPKAKQWLLSEGKTPEEIKNLPVAKVLGLWSVYRFAIVRDEYLKCSELPAWQLRAINPESFWNDGKFEIATPLDVLASLMFPAITAYRNALARAEANNDLMRIVEAIRLYGAEHDGKLPERLEEITSVPIPPFDPMSGQPYVYTLKDGTATVESNQGYQIMRFKIRLR